MKIAKTGPRIRNLQQQVAAVAYSAAGVLPFEAKRPFFITHALNRFLLIFSKLPFSTLIMADDPKLKALLRYLSTETVTDEARTLADKVAAFKRHFLSAASNTASPAV